MGSGMLVYYIKSPDTAEQWDEVGPQLRFPSAPTYCHILFSDEFLKLNHKYLLLCLEMNELCL